MTAARSKSRRVARDAMTGKFIPEREALARKKTSIVHRYPRRKRRHGSSADR